MLSSPNVFLRPREAAKRADEAKSKFTHIDGARLHHKLTVCIPGFHASPAPPQTCSMHAWLLHAVCLERSVQNVVKHLQGALAFTMPHAARLLQVTISLSSMCTMHTSRTRKAETGATTTS